MIESRSLRSAAQEFVSGLKIFGEDAWRCVAPYVGHNPNRDNHAADRRTDSGGMGEAGVSNQAAASTGSQRDLSGRGMDRHIDTSRKKLLIGIGAGVAALAFARSPGRCGRQRRACMW
jgi:hypothetical protein